jgi:hypothetical protein
MNIKDAIQNTKQIYLSDSSLNILMDFERVLDEIDLYAFDHWIKGEIVDGPKIGKYWVTCRFMWPYKMMPDPSGGKRLIPYGCKIFYEKTKIKVPVKIKSPDDFDPTQPGSRKAKLAEVKVWLVTIKMPRNLIDDIEQGSLEIAGEQVDLEDMQQAYDQGLDQQALSKDEGDMGMGPEGGMGDMGMDDPAQGGQQQNGVM